MMGSGEWKVDRNDSCTLPRKPSLSLPLTVFFQLPVGAGLAGRTPQIEGAWLPDCVVGPLPNTHRGLLGEQEKKKSIV